MRRRQTQRMAKPQAEGLGDVNRSTDLRRYILAFWSRHNVNPEACLPLVVLQGATTGRDPAVVRARQKGPKKENGFLVEKYKINHKDGCANFGCTFHIFRRGPLLKCAGPCDDKVKPYYCDKSSQRSVSILWSLMALWLTRRPFKALEVP